MDHDSLKAFIETLAQESARVILPWFANPDLRVEQKSDATPVTRADRDAELHLRKLILERYPDHGLIGEEYGNDREDAEYVWVLDPIDGTKTFTAHNAQFGTLIGLLHKGQPLLGAINLPACNQLLIGDGETTTLNGRAVSVRPAPALSQAILCTTDLDAPGRDQDAEGWDALRRSVRKLYTWGDCYGYALVAMGGIDIMCDPVMSPWDLLPLIPVLKGAGCKVSDWHGGPVEKGSSCVAAHPDLHGQVIRLLNR